MKTSIAFAFAFAAVAANAEARSTAAQQIIDGRANNFASLQGDPIADPLTTISSWAGKARVLGMDCAVRNKSILTQAYAYECSRAFSTEAAAAKLVKQTQSAFRSAAHGFSFWRSAGSSMIDGAPVQSVGGTSKQNCFVFLEVDMEKKIVHFVVTADAWPKAMLDNS